MSTWPNFIFDIGLLVAAVITVFEATRRIAYDGITRKRILAVMGGIILCALLSALQFYVSTMDSLKFEPKDVAELAPDWGGELSPAQREQVSVTRASVIYTSTGTLVDYVDASGMRKKYAPTQADLKLRESTVLMNQQIDTLSRNAYTNGFQWALFPLFALIIGWMIGREQRQKAANQSLQNGR
jgi:hypothetical protein